MEITYIIWRRFFHLLFEIFKRKKLSLFQNISPFRRYFPILSLITHLLFNEFLI